jgi:hypothetical protein
MLLWQLMMPLKKICHMILTERWRSPFLEVLEEVRLKFLGMFGHRKYQLIVLYMTLWTHQLICVLNWIMSVLAFILDILYPPSLHLVGKAVSLLPYLSRRVFTTSSLRFRSYSCRGGMLIVLYIIVLFILFCRVMITSFIIMNLWYISIGFCMIRMWKLAKLEDVSIKL